MTLLIALTLFVLSVFLGVELISKVPPTLHTPLMSGSNAISGITLIGALISAGTDHSADGHDLRVLRGDPRDGERRRRVPRDESDARHVPLEARREAQREARRKAGRGPLMSNFIQAGYLVAAVLFVLGLKGLARPRTAVRGNLFGALGMLTAVLVTLTDKAIVSYWVLVAGLAAGAVIGIVLAVKVQMTGMPELVALFNGLGGAASVLVVLASYLEAPFAIREEERFIIAVGLSALIGAITFTGSVVAFGKLRESIGTWRSAATTWINVALLAGSVFAVIVLAMEPIGAAG